MKKLFLLALFLIFIGCSSDNSMQSKEICHYETACADAPQTGGFRDRRSGCKLPYQKQVCEEIHY